jgi:hypothetical protein
MEVKVDHIYHDDGNDGDKTPAVEASNYANPSASMAFAS